MNKNIADILFYYHFGDLINLVNIQNNSNSIVLDFQNEYETYQKIIDNHEGEERCLINPFYKRCDDGYHVKKII